MGRLTIAGLECAPSCCRDVKRGRLTPMKRERTPEQEKRFVVLVLGVGVYGGLLFLISVASQYVRRPDDFFHAKELFLLVVSAVVCAALGYVWGLLLWKYRQWARGRRMKAAQAKTDSSGGQGDA